MNYRELQQKLKDMGLNAKGSKAELEERYKEANKTSAVEPEVVKSDGKTRYFVFTGDPGKGKQGQDPQFCSACGHLFKLNGAKVAVDAKSAARLQNNSHFTEA